MNRVFTALVGLACIFLLFVVGAASIHFDKGVPKFLEEAFIELEAAANHAGYQPERGWLFIGAKSETEDDWNNPPAPETEPGLKFYDPERAENGYTLYSSFYKGLPIKLIDMQGNTIHEWYLPEQFNNGKRDDGIKFRSEARPLAGDKWLYPDGRLLVNFNHSLGYPLWGFGLAMLDKDSNVLWSYTKQVHHLLDVEPDGTILAMLHEWQNEPWPGLEMIKTRFQSEFIVELSPTGEELRKVSVLKAIQDSPWHSILQYVDTEAPGGDIFHANAVRYLDASAAAALPNAEPGDVLVSLRDIDTLIVLDLDAVTVKWATRGPWHMQHDPWVLDNGHILLFDNKGDMKNAGHSRALEFDPQTHEVVWEFPGDKPFDLYSAICGSVSRLNNGNTLITESNRGHLLEVTEAGDVVWDYYIPERVPYSQHITVKALHARRYAPESLDFLTAD